MLTDNNVQWTQIKIQNISASFEIREAVITDLDEESHHVEELFNVDSAISVLIKQVEHLWGIKFGFEEKEKIWLQDQEVFCIKP